MSMFHELMMKKKGIPERYQEVEYIESDGTQYIDTGITPSATKEFNIDFAFSSTSVGRMGCINNDVTICRYYFGVISNLFGASISSQYNHTVEVANTDRHLFVLKNDGFYIDGTLKYSSTGQYSYTNLSFYILGTHDLMAGTGDNKINYLCSGKLYGAKIYDNDRLVRNFIPVYDTLTQKYGMWESVQGKFYGNDGTGDFGGSIVGYTIVGSPTIVDGVVSGFSSANYLTLNKALTVKNTMDIEIYVRAKMPPTISSGFNFVYNNTSGYPSYFYLGTYSSAVFTASMHLSILKFSDIYITVQTETWYRFKITGKDGIWKFEIYDDNGNLLKEQTKDWSSSSVNVDYTLKFQCIDNTNTYSGSIDMNETYIKKDGKLWFNGQQA